MQLNKSSLSSLFLRGACRPCWESERFVLLEETRSSSLVHAGPESLAAGTSAGSTPLRLAGVRELCSGAEETASLGRTEPGSSRCS